MCFLASLQDNEGECKHAVNPSLCSPPPFTQNNNQYVVMKLATSITDQELWHKHSLNMASRAAVIFFNRFESIFLLLTLLSHLRGTGWELWLNRYPFDLEDALE